MIRRTERSGDGACMTQISVVALEKKVLGA